MCAHRVDDDGICYIKKRERRNRCKHSIGRWKGEYEGGKRSEQGLRGIAGERTRGRGREKKERKREREEREERKREECMYTAVNSVRLLHTGRLGFHDDTFHRIAMK